MYKQFYRRFLEANAGQLRFTAHSHHYWPDATREAALRYWDDSARLVDGKWAELFEVEVGAARRAVAEVLKLASPGDVVFAPNTHELVCRLFSCLPADRPVRVLTTDSEFHSFSRQAGRLQAERLVELEVVPVLPVDTFAGRLRAAAAAGGHDMVFFSQVFYNSGYAVDDLEAVVAAVPDEGTLVAVDGYHGFCALPTDLSRVCRRAFYLAGGYKYAQAGEGVCFLAVPPGCELEPRLTGWFADLGGLAGDGPGAAVAYPPGAMRFAGATFDPSGVYRFNSVMALWREHGITVEAVHAWVEALQARFLSGLEGLCHPDLHCGNLMLRERGEHGHFLTFELLSAARAAAIANDLRRLGVHTDHRADRLRFGFGMQHDESDIDDCLRRMQTLVQQGSAGLRETAPGSP